MPTGVAIRDAREQLFAAAERLLLQGGPGALTSRAVTAEAGVAKGVLHRHFADFDDFLTELTLDRIRHIEGQAAALRAAAGTGSVVGNLSAALADYFGSVALPLIDLVITRDELRARLRQAGAGRLPVAVQCTAMVAAYLAAERDLGRVSADADVAGLAPMLVGAGHLEFSARDGSPVDEAAIRKAVVTIIGGVLREQS